MNPPISVIVPTRNSAATLEACLQSIKRQTYRPIELIVVDNASDDDTVAIARRFTDHVLHRGPERSAQRNAGAAYASGDYVLFIDADMELEPAVVAACTDRVVSDHTTQALIIPEASFGEGFWATCKQLERSFYHGVDWIEAARFYNKQLFFKAGGYNETMVSGEDWELSQRVGKLARVGRVGPHIRHNEGRLRLGTTLSKKIYYARQFTHYTQSASSQQAVHGASPVAITMRRFKLFLADPQRLWRRPHVGLGMLFMKACEFGFGALGYIAARVSQRDQDDRA